jgi:hypothetical protein
MRSLRFAAAEVPGIKDTNPPLESGTSEIDYLVFNEGTAASDPNLLKF